ncbi:MFS transporter [Prevotella sp.]|jgi:nitrate/nitrite transporter NarK|uniref:MFS transporter n=1 Tax=Prevotella sp. TaxID=59823 RepID=UPI0025EC85A7|nr:MFS transporter [Prevotella sp.]
MQKLSDSPAMRWTALVLLASAMFFAYIFVDVLSPLQGLLQTQRGWDPDAYGHFAGSEPFLNVFVFFLIFAGIILDKMGVRFTAVLSGVVMVLGAAINWYAVTDLFDASSAKTFMDNTLNLPQAWWNVTPWYDGMPASAKLSAIGFMIFGCGAEMAGITVSRGIVKWFTGHEMALAMGIEMAIARIGVAVVMLGSPFLASINPISVSRPVAASLLLVCIGLICFISYGFMDKKLDAQGAEEEKDDPFKVSDIGKILSLRMFWVVALLCVLYYSAIFPFQKYAINMLQCNLHFTAEQAGQVFFMFPLGAAAVTPFLGNFLDRKGKGASMLILGAVLMIVCHLIFAFVVPTTQSVIITLAAIIVLGISFSLVPAALWPSVPKLIDGKLLGSAYALIFWIQNIGLYAFPMIIGSVLKASNPGVTDPLKYNYTVPMVVFASLGVAALFLGLYLKAIDRKGGYGLEEPNIKK